MKNSNLPPISEEQLSQMMDGEWDGLNTSECVVGICNDDQLRDKWSRYHLIRDCIKSEPLQVNNKLFTDISAAIADEPAYSNVSSLSTFGEAAGTEQNRDDDKQTSTQPSETVKPIATPIDSKPAFAKKQSTVWGTGFKGFAVAASVAAVTVVGMNAWQGQNANPANPAGLSIADTSLIPSVGVDAFSQQVDGAPLPQVELVGNTGAYWVSPQTAERVGDEQRLNMFLSQHLENSPTASREGLLSYSRLVGYDTQAAEQ